MVDLTKGSRPPKARLEIVGEDAIKWASEVANPSRVRRWIEDMAGRIARKTLGMDEASVVRESSEAMAVVETVRVTTALLLEDGLLVSEVALVLGAGVCGGLEGFTAAGQAITGRIAPKRSRAVKTDAADRLADQIDKVLREDGGSGEGS